MFLQIALNLTYASIDNIYVISDFCASSNCRPDRMAAGNSGCKTSPDIL